MTDTAAVRANPASADEKVTECKRLKGDKERRKRDGGNMNITTECETNSTTNCEMTDTAAVRLNPANVDEKVTECKRLKCDKERRKRDGGNMNITTECEMNSTANCETSQTSVNKTVTIPLPESDPVKELAAPDGGWGWVVCFACFMTHVLTDGMFYSFGVVYVELLDYYKGTKGETAWIASLAPGILLLIGPVVGALTNRFGCRKISMIGAFVTSGSFIISIFAPNLHFLYLSLGVMTGIGYGLVYLPSIVCVSQYFEKHRALATGLGVCGSGIGTFIFSPFTKYLIESYTWKGAILIQGGLVLNCVACGAVYRPLSENAKQRTGKDVPLEDKNNFHSTESVLFTDLTLGTVIEARITRSNSSVPNYMPYNTHSFDYAAEAMTASKYLPNMTENEINQVISRRCSRSIPRAPFVARQVSYIADTHAENKHPAIVDEIWIGIKESFGLYRNKAFCIFVVSTFFYSIGYYVPYVYLPDKAKDAGISDYKAALLLSSIGITNTVGRVIFRYLSDRNWVNRIYLYSTALAICGISTCLAPLAVTFVTMLLYTIMFGLFSGVTISLTSVIITDLVGIDRLADGFGLSNMFGGFAAFLGPPIAGWLYDGTGSYDVSFVASGVAIAIAGFMLYFVPCIFLKKRVNDWE